jgi:hypothetical protein
METGVLKMKKMLFAIIGILALISMLVFLHGCLQKIADAYRYSSTQKRMEYIAHVIKCSYTNDMQEMMNVIKRKNIDMCDDWGYPLHLRLNNNGFSLISYGKNNIAGGHDVFSDIIVKWIVGHTGITVNSANIRP